MGLAKVGQRSGERTTDAAVRKKAFHTNDLLFTSALVFLSICLNGEEGHNEEQDGGRANSDGLNVERWQPVREVAFIQSCF